MAQVLTNLSGGIYRAEAGLEHPRVNPLVFGLGCRGPQGGTFLDKQQEGIQES